MATTKSIKKEVEVIPEKKESLRKVFEELRSLSGALSSFTLKWQDLDNHFSSLNSSIDLRFKQLQSLDNEKHLPSKLIRSGLPSPNPNSFLPESDPRPELLVLCSGMDGPGLFHFLTENRKVIASLRPELAPAIRSAPDPAKLVLDAVSVPFDFGKKEYEHFGYRTRILLLEKLCTVSPDDISTEVTEGARKVAAEWKKKIRNRKEGGGGLGNLDADRPAWALLQLVAAYGIASEYHVDELLDLVVPIAKRKPVVDLCNALGLVEHIPTLIEILISEKKQLHAVKFVYAYGLVEKFPPVPLLKDYVKESKNAVQEVLEKGKHSAQSRNEAIDKEISALKSVIRTTREYNLESEYPTESLQKQVDQLEKAKAERKRSTTSRSQEDANKRPRVDKSLAASAAFAGAPLQLNPPQPYMANRASYLGSTLSSAASYGRSGGAGLGLLEPSLVPGGMAKLSPPRLSYLYPPESRIQRSDLYDRPGAHVMPLAYDRQAPYDRPLANARSSGYANYSLS